MLEPSNLGAHNIGGINASGQVPSLTGRFSLIDPDTPSSSNFYTSHNDGSQWQIIFSDEFNVDGRSFYPVSLIYEARPIIWPYLFCYIVGR